MLHVSQFLRNHCGVLVGLTLFRQMMQHLHRLHHVAGWLDEQGHADLPPQQLLQKVEQLRKSKKDVQGNVRVLADPDR